MALIRATYILLFLLQIVLSQGRIQEQCSTNGKITVDNKLTFYADGQLILDGSISGNANDWTKSDSVTFPSTTQVYAVKGVDTGVKAGIIASFDNGLVTDGSWKCTDTLYPGWQTVGFDDSNWAPAYIIGNYGMGPWGTQPSIDNTHDPKWIWTTGWISSQANSDREVYCRKTVEIVDEVPEGCTFSACGKCSKAADKCGVGLVSGQLNCGGSLARTRGSTRSVVMRCCCQPCQGGTAGGTGGQPHPQPLCRDVLPPFEKKETDPMCATYQSTQPM